ncbi:DUF6470 family protein [Paenibacillus aquistagni]|uniref:DUF6470 family protein n=1 Tax=Paenibacillus aquistagni TaxID=1852522 RepID=UPI00145BB0ED|nr:DUF6470 family protein [Paenibacillus aquistagni]NMM54312.1 hypothetical protein [Paenibacillus aquistagni]
MQIGNILQQIQTPTFKYEPPEMDIRTRSAELDADWDAIWEELGVLPSSAFMKSLSEESVRKGLDAIQQRAQDGDRMGNIAKGKVTAGQLAFERYIHNGKKEIQLEMLPKFGVSIDVRIYAPEIEVKTKGVVRS